uniref:Uncharacterized protein n=1 Tax=Amphiprion percula TaxID=161767 RepID=A0A3P8U217_AMPPE
FVLGDTGKKKNRHCDVLELFEMPVIKQSGGKPETESISSKYRYSHLMETERRLWCNNLLLQK